MTKKIKILYVRDATGQFKMNDNGKIEIVFYELNKQMKGYIL